MSSIDSRDLNIQSSSPRPECNATLLQRVALAALFTNLTVGCMGDGESAPGNFDGYEETGMSGLTSDTDHPTADDEPGDTEDETGANESSGGEIACENWQDYPTGDTPSWGGQLAYQAPYYSMLTESEISAKLAIVGNQTSTSDSETYAGFFAKYYATGYPICLLEDKPRTQYNSVARYGSPEQELIRVVGRASTNADPDHPVGFAKIFHDCLEIDEEIGLWGQSMIVDTYPFGRYDYVDVGEKINPPEGGVFSPYLAVYMDDQQQGTFQDSSTGTFKSVVMGEDGTIFAGGNRDSEAVVFAFDSFANPLWTHTYSGGDHPSVTDLAIGSIEVRDENGEVTLQPHLLVATNYNDAGSPYSEINLLTTNGIEAGVLPNSTINGSINAVGQIPFGEAICHVGEAELSATVNCYPDSWHYMYDDFDEPGSAQSISFSEGQMVFIAGQGNDEKDRVWGAGICERKD